MRVYAIILIQEGSNLDYGIEPIGMYSTLELALEYIEKLEEVTPENDCMYDVFEFVVDEKPLMLEFLEKRNKFQKLYDQNFQLKKTFRQRYNQVC